MRLAGRMTSVLSAVLVSACALIESPAERAIALAAGAGFVKVELADAHVTALSRGATSRRLVVYVESDGAPWRFRDAPPADPTPIRPLVLRMAISDPSAGVAYLGRPCQYLSEQDLSRCDPELWMQGRFREDAVAAMNRAVDSLKRRFGAREISLIGYSGGGAMAALVAARRDDVACLVTIASPLDTRAWANALGVSPLRSSLNPADFVGRLRGIRQTHYRGLRDEVVPPATSTRFIMQVQADEVVDMPDFDHQCCWDSSWAQLRQRSCASV